MGIVRIRQIHNRPDLLRLVFDCQTFGVAPVAEPGVLVEQLLPSVTHGDSSPQEGEPDGSWRAAAAALLCCDYRADD